MFTAFDAAVFSGHWYIGVTCMSETHCISRCY